MTTSDLTRRAYDLLSDGSATDRCQDLTKQACAAQPASFLTTLASLSLTKTGDGIVNPKIVLSWLVTALGAPGYIAGLLVPVREGLALLPQIMIAAFMVRQPVRKWFWIAGSAGQAVAVLGIAAVAATLDGTEAGWAIVILLALFALSRAFCSVSFKDVLGKTVAKSQRGKVTGYASSLSGLVVLAMGLCLAFELIDRSLSAVALALVVAGALWLGAAALFATLREYGDDGAGKETPAIVSVGQIVGAIRDPDLRRFLVARGFLMATALTPPYFVALAGEGEPSFRILGLFLIAAAAATALSSAIWGWLADRSSRTVLILAGLLAGAINAAVALVALGWPNLVGGIALLAPAVFFVSVAHAGVRLGRSTHIVDMSGSDERAANVSVANTVVGLLLVVAGLLVGLLASLAGAAVAIAALAVMAVAGAGAAYRLSEVQRNADGENS